MEKPASIVLTSLLLLPITGLEEIVGYLGNTDLNVIIESFLSSHQTGFLATFELGAIPVLRGRPRPANPVEDRFQRAWRA